MVEKKFSFFSKKFCTMFLFAALTAFIISSCEKEKAPEVDPNTLPMANFFCQIQYRTHGDATYAFVTATNNSSYSNRWEWRRPGSRPEISGETVFITNKDTTVTQAYLATDQEQKFQITLTAYNDMPIGVNPDSTIIYKIFESRPFLQEIKVKKP